MTVVMSFDDYFQLIELKSRVEGVLYAIERVPEEYRAEAALRLIELLKGEVLTAYENTPKSK
jgi:hypothetical protein